jgi:DNA ligase-1
MSKVTKKWPKLYHKTKTGAIQEWQVHVEGDTIVSTHGKQGGKMQVARLIATPKNVGKANATTPEEQAMVEAEAMHKHKLERKYRLTVDDAVEKPFLPMLAHEFSKNEKKVIYPVYTQHKLDGVRALAKWDGDRVVLISRGGKEWTEVKHINKKLERELPKNCVFDGEIYLHGKTLQWINSRTKKFYPGETDKLQYHVYDMPVIKGEDDHAWYRRMRELDEAELEDAYMSTESPQSIVFMVETDIALNAIEVKKQHDTLVLQGYEGLIVRDYNGVYEWGARSRNLLKLKEFEDAEFEIIGSRGGEPGSVEADLVIWKCRNDTNNLEFETRPRGTHNDRRELLKISNKYKGQKLTVRFFGRTVDGLPNLPIGHAIRLEEDMS